MEDKSRKSTLSTGLGKDFKIPEGENIFHKREGYKLLLDVSSFEGYPRAASACFISCSA